MGGRLVGWVNNNNINMGECLLIITIVQQSNPTSTVVIQSRKMIHSETLECCCRMDVGPSGSVTDSPVLVGYLNLISVVTLPACNNNFHNLSFDVLMLLQHAGHRPDDEFQIRVY